MSREQEQFEAWWLEQSQQAWEKSNHSNLPMPECWVNAGKNIGKRAWQASRSCIEVELPESRGSANEYEGRLYVSEVVEALQRQGIKVKQ